MGLSLLAIAECAEHFEGDGREEEHAEHDAQARGARGETAAEAMPPVPPTGLVSCDDVD